MQLPSFFGKIVYFFGYPVFRLLIKGSYRAYVAVLVDDSILLTKNWLGFQKKWRLAGGGIKENETPSHAALRELAEEVGIVADYSQLVKLNTKPILASFSYRYDLFVLRLPKPPTLVIDKKEIIFAEYIKKSDISRHAISEETAKALQQIGWR